MVVFLESVSLLLLFVFCEGPTDKANAAWRTSQKHHVFALMGSVRKGCQAGWMHASVRKKCVVQSCAAKSHFLSKKLQLTA